MDKKQRNGLEVTCIGSLYQGPWEKKYWSSSRGKDRYPYPVGFHAVRCYNGETYQMEIHEGTRGPLFVVSFGDKMTCSGDTPTIAWQNAMKKLNSHSRKANQRLLNANSNGSELFGFLNPLVQRLFRELVSSQGGEAHQSDEVYEAFSQNRGEMKRERKAVEQDESKALPTNLSWQSTKTLSVRKSRTSIVSSRNSKLMTVSSERSRLQSEPGTCKTAAKDTLGCSPLEDHADISHPEQSCNPSGRKRLKLLKPTKIIEKSSPNNKPSSCMLPELIANASSPDFLLDQSDSEQGNKQDGEYFICGINSSSDMKRHKLNSSSKDVNANKTHNLETMAVVIPDSFDDLSSQILIKDTEQIVSSLPHSLVLKQDPKNVTPFLDSHRNATFQEDRLVVPDTFDELSQIYKERGKEQEPQTSKQIIPVTETNLDKSTCPENKKEDSNLLIRGEEKRQLMMNELAPDSCDTENVSMLSKDASKSTGGVIINSQGLLVEIPGDNMLLEHTTESLEGAAITSQGSLEQNPVDTYKGTSHYSTLDNSQCSENNMEKCESDSLGQEITKSMITLLLPQALQLLEKKRKRKIKSIIPPSVDESHVQSDAIGQPSDAFDKNMKSINDGMFDPNVYTSAVRCDGDVNDKCNMVEKNGPQDSENSRCNSLVASIEADKFNSLQCPNVKDLVLLNQDLDGVRDAMTVVDGISRDSAIATSSSFTGKNVPKRFEMHAASPGNLGKCDNLELFPHEMLPQSSLSLNVDKPFGNFGSTKSEDFAHPDAENILDSGCQKVCPSPAEYLDAVHGPSTDFKSSVLEVNDALCHARVLTYLPTIETNASEQPDSEKSLCFYSAPDKNVSSPDSKFEMPRSSLAFKRHLPQSDNFEPKACLEHPMPVLAMKVHVQNDDIRFFVLCGYPNQNSRILFVYNVTEKGVGLSLINSINLNILECGCDVPHIELAETNGICFTPDGQELVLLGTFSINRERDHIDERSALVSQKPKCLHGVTLVSYTNSETLIHTELSSFGRHVYSLLVCNPYMVIAGGENGFVSGWEMDAIWRNCKRNFILPVPEGFKLSHVIQLLAVPHCPYLVVGCDDRSVMAIWNISKHQLLRTSSLFVVSPLEVHILEIDIVNQQQNDGSEINVNSDRKFEETGDSITVSLLYGTLGRNDSNSLSSTEQTFSRTWTLEVFQRDGNTRVFFLDMDQRVSAMSIMDRLGIAGTYGGYVYIWDTIKGSIKQTCKDFEGVPIACIASNWACDVVVVADVNARVMIYMKQASM